MPSSYVHTQSRGKDTSECHKPSGRPQEKKVQKRWSILPQTVSWDWLEYVLESTVPTCPGAARPVGLCGISGGCSGPSLLGSSKWCLLFHPNEGHLPAPTPSPVWHASWPAHPSPFPPSPTPSPPTPRTALAPIQFGWHMGNAAQPWTGALELNAAASISPAPMQRCSSSPLSTILYRAGMARLMGPGHIQNSIWEAGAFPAQGHVRALAGGGDLLASPVRFCARSEDATLPKSGLHGLVDRP